MSDPMVSAARDRALVVLDDGRLVQLVYWPGRNRRRGRQATIKIESGAYMSVPTDRIKERWR